MEIPLVRIAYRRVLFIALVSFVFSVPLAFAQEEGERLRLKCTPSAVHHAQRPARRALGQPRVGRCVCGGHHAPANGFRLVSLWLMVVRQWRAVFAEEIVRSLKGRLHIRV